MAKNESAANGPVKAVQIKGVETKAQEKRFLVILGRSRRLATESHQAELTHIMHERVKSGGTAINSDVRKTLGDVATALVSFELHSGLVVVQAVVGSA